MTYALSNPPAMASQRVGAAGGAIWIYKDGDSLSTIGGINYVSNAADLGMKAGDKVIVINSSDGTTTDASVVAHRTSGTQALNKVDAIEPVGETSISTGSSGTGTVLIGDIIIFDNDTALTEYEVTTGDADVSGGATLVITPGLVVATAVGTGYKQKTNVLNVSVGNEATRLKNPPGTYQVLASESGTTFTFSTTAGQDLTLPTAVPGLKYRFVWTVAQTSATSTIVCDTGDFFLGIVHGVVEGAATDEAHAANGTSIGTLTTNATTQGGKIGGWIELEAISDTIWSIKGTLMCTGSPITPFS